MKQPRPPCDVNPNGGGADLCIWLYVVIDVLLRSRWRANSLVRMYWMWRKGCDYQQLLKFGSHVGQLETGNGVK
jgi:hypothetical protein